MATVVVNNGKAIITNRIKGSGTEPRFLAWGTGNGTAAASDTALFAEDTSVGYARVSGTSSQQTTSQTNDTYQVVGTITAQANLSITEAGLLDASTSGNLFVHGNFNAVALSTGDSISFTVKIQFS